MIKQYLIYFKIVGILAILSAAFFGGCSMQKNIDNSKISNYQVEIANMKTAQAKELKQQAEDALAVIKKKQEEIAALDKKHTEIEERAKEKYEATIAKLRAGQLSVRPRLTCPVVSPSTGPSDGATQGGLQREDAEFLLSESERADEIVRQLTEAQEIINKLTEGK